jgi:hypothetical protein
MATKTKAAAPTTKPAAKATATNLPANRPDLSKFAGMGLEGTTKDDFAIPFLTILQSNSPQLKANKDARQGLFINSITGELFSTMRVIPCGYQRRFIRWAPRAGGGGYKGQYDPIAVLDKQKPLAGLSEHLGRLLMDVPEKEKSVFDDKGVPRFDHLADTRHHFVLMQSGTGEWQQAVLGLASTQIKRSKNWMGQIALLKDKRPDGSSFTPPSFSHIYRLTAVEERNAKGEWWGMDVTMDGPVLDAALLDQAYAFYQTVQSGAINVAPPTQDGEASTGHENV